MIADKYTERVKTGMPEIQKKVYSFAKRRFVGPREFVVFFFFFFFSLEVLIGHAQSGEVIIHTIF